MFKSKLSFSEKVAKISELRTEELKLMDEIMEEMKLAQKVLGFMDAESSGTKTHKRRREQLKLNEPKECKHCGELFTGTTLELATHVRMKHKYAKRGGQPSKYPIKKLKRGRAKCRACEKVIKRTSISQHYKFKHPEIAANIYKPRKKPSKEGFWN
jgi:hypothetical protein